MKIYPICLLIWFCCEATSLPNGSNSQQPYVKWAIAHSYSWVVEPRKLEPISRYHNNFDTLSHQAEEQANRIQQQALQQAQQQALQQAQHRAMLQAQQQAQQQALQQAQQQAQQQALQQAQQYAMQQMQRQAEQQASKQLLPQTDQQVTDQVHQQPMKHLPQSSSYRDYNRPNEYNGRTHNHLQTEYVTPSSLRINEISNPLTLHYSKDFIDGIVEKVIQKTRRNSNSALPTTTGDIEKIVREILLEYSRNIPDANRNVNQNYENVPSNNRVFRGNNINPQNAKLIGTYPITQTYPITEQVNPQVECIFNCGIPQNSYSSGEPIAIAIANSFYAPNRSTDPRILANSFTYTSV